MPLTTLWTIWTRPSDRGAAPERLVGVDLDDDLAGWATLVQVADGLGGLGERVRAVDDGRDLACLDELSKRVSTGARSIWRPKPPVQRLPPSPPTMTRVPSGASA